MTIGTNNRNDAIGNDAASVYPYGFKIFAATDLEVTVRSSAGVETVLSYPLAYSVSGVGLAAGGSVTLADLDAVYQNADATLKTGYAITIRRIRPLTQATDIRNQGGFFAATHEDTFDHLMMVDQQQQDEIDRSLRLPVTETPIDAQLFLPFDRAGKFLAFNGAKELIASAGSTTGMPAEAVGQVVSTIAALKAMDVPSAAISVFVLGYYAAHDLGGGQYTWDAASVAADNGGTVIRPNSAPASGRWRLRIYDEVSLGQFGCKFDGATDDTARFNAAKAAAAGAFPLFAPAGTCMLSSATFSTNGVHMRGCGQFITIFKANTVRTGDAVEWNNAFWIFLNSARHSFKDFTLDANDKCSYTKIHVAQPSNTTGTQVFERIYHMGALANTWVLADATGTNDCSFIHHIDCSLRSVGAAGVPLQSQIRCDADNSNDNVWEGGMICSPGQESTYNVYMTVGLLHFQGDPFFGGSSSWDFEVRGGAALIESAETESTGGFFHSHDSDTTGISQIPHSIKNLRGSAAGATLIHHEARRVLCLGDIQSGGDIQVGKVGGAGLATSEVKLTGPVSFSNNTTRFAAAATGTPFILTNTVAANSLAHIVTITNLTATDHSAKTIAVIGTSANNDAQTETINLPGPNATVRTTLRFKDVTDGAGHLTPSASIGADTMAIGYERDFVLSNGGNGLFYSQKSTSNLSAAQDDAQHRDILYRTAAPRSGLVRTCTTAGSPYAVDATWSGYTVSVTSTATLNLPATVNGLNLRIAIQGTDGFVGCTLNPNAVDKFVGAGITAADNKDLISAVATAKYGDSVEIHGDGTDGWYIQAMNGTWAREA